MKDSITEMIEGSAEDSALADSGNPFKRAARAVREALKEDSGRRKKMDHWRGVAREALGKKRMSKKLWEKVLATGLEAGMFSVDFDALSYPILVADTPQGKTLMEVFADELDAEEETPVVVDKRQEVPAAPTTFTGDPPKHLPCGHWSRQEIPKPDDECTQAELERKKDYKSVTPRKTVVVEDVKDCIHCRKGTKNPDWRAQKEGYKTPVPMSQRRTKEKEEGPGWPGLCTDPATGFYIGGLGNDCRRYHEGPERCEAHAPTPKKNPEPEPKKRKVKKTRRKEKAA